jgi:hypothetical protein
MELINAGVRVWGRRELGRGETAAEWRFSWVLDGRAVADVWINPRRVVRQRFEAARAG